MKKCRLCWLLSLCLGWTLVSCSSRIPSGPIQQGRTLEKQGEYLAASQHYRKMKEPETEQVCSRNLRYLYGDILDAMLALQETPSSPEKYYTLGKAFYDKAHSLPAGAEVVPSAGFDSARYFAQQQEWYQQRALTALDSALQMQSGYQEALLLQAHIYEQQGEPEKALSLYQQLVERQTSNPEVWYRYAHLLYRQGKVQEGLDFAKQAIELAPEHPAAHFVLGVLYENEGEDDLAITAFHHALCGLPQVSDIYYRLAYMFLKQNNFIDAERIIRLGVAQNPQSIQLGLFYTALRSMVDAQEQERAAQIYRRFEGEMTKNTEGTVDIADQQPTVQLQYLRLRLQLIQRQRPYLLPCSDEEENPYFENQIAQTQSKINELEQLLVETD